MFAFYQQLHHVVKNREKISAATAYSPLQVGYVVLLVVRHVDAIERRIEPNGMHLLKVIVLGLVSKNVVADLD